LIIALAFLIGFGFFVSNPNTGDPIHIRLPGGVRVELLDCPFRSLTGLPCPICGISRSSALMLHGDVVGSFRAHPIGPLFILAAIAAIVWAPFVLLIPERIPDNRERQTERSRAGGRIGPIILLVLLATWAINLVRHFGLVNW